MAHAIALVSEPVQPTESLIIEEFTGRFFQRFNVNPNRPFEWRGPSNIGRVWHEFLQPSKVGRGSSDELILKGFEVLSGNLGREDLSIIISAFAQAVQNRFGPKGLRMIYDDLLPRLEKSLVDNQSIEPTPLASTFYLRKMLAEIDQTRVNNVSILKRRISSRIRFLDGKIDLGNCLLLLESRLKFF